MSHQFGIEIGDEQPRGLEYGVRAPVLQVRQVQDLQRSNQGLHTYPSAGADINMLVQTQPSPNVKSDSRRTLCACFEQTQILEACSPMQKYRTLLAQAMLG